MLYSYTAKNKEGKVYTGAEDAKSKLELYAKVRSEGGAVLTVRDAGSAKFNLNISFDRVSTHDKILLAKNLSSMLSAGLSLPRAIGVMERETRNTAMKKLLASLSASVSRGDAFSESLGKERKAFSPLFISMVKAGEESGDMPGALKVIATEMEKSYLLTKRVRGAMIYPAIIICLMVVISILLLIYMVPTLTETFKGLDIELPLSTRIIIGASSFLVTHTLIALTAAVCIALGLLSLFRSKWGKSMLDALSIRLPVVGPMIREIWSARTARTLSSLLSAGVAVGEALSVTSRVVQNHLYRDALTSARAAVEKGEQLSVIFNKYPELYPAFMPEMVAVGEETGKLAEMLGNVAVYYEEEVDEKTKDLSTVIEPALMILVGIAVAIFAVSMLAPTYSLVNTIQ